MNKRIWLGLVVIWGLAMPGCIEDDNQRGPGDECLKASDCEDDGNACTNEMCDTTGFVNVCSSTPVAENEVCDLAGGDPNDGVCDGAGACVACLSDASCDDDNECTADNCTLEHTCLNSALTGELCDLDATDDGVCSDEGVCEAPGCTENEDCEDNNDCTIDTCDSFTCNHANQPINTACDDNGGLFCTAGGTCVECNTTPQCPGVGETCVLNVCEAPFDCGPPPAVTNGDCVGGSGQTVGAMRTCSCMSPYTRVGNSSITCTGGGWSTAPTCTCDSHILTYELTGTLYVHPPLVPNLQATISTPTTAYPGSGGAVPSTIENGYIRVRVPAANLTQVETSDGTPVQVLEFFFPQEFRQCPLNSGASSGNGCRDVVNPALRITSDITAFAVNDDGTRVSTTNTCAITTGTIDVTSGVTSAQWDTCAVSSANLNNQCYFPETTPGDPPACTGTGTSSSPDPNPIKVSGAGGPGCLRSRNIGNIKCEGSLCGVGGLTVGDNCQEASWRQILLPNAVFDTSTNPPLTFTIGDPTRVIPTSMAETLPSDLKGLILANEAAASTVLALKGTRVAMSACQPIPTSCVAPTNPPFSNINGLPDFCASPPTPPTLP